LVSSSVSNVTIRDRTAAFVDALASVLIPPNILSADESVHRSLPEGSRTYQHAAPFLTLGQAQCPVADILLDFARKGEAAWFTRGDAAPEYAAEPLIQLAN
jgi:hypothetical protein